MARQQASKGALTMRAPSLRIRSSFVSGAVSMATTVQGMPASRAAKATPCPAFPALMVHTPLLRASSVRRLPSGTPPTRAEDQTNTSDVPCSPST